jgi:Flp pilus assembly protein TadG
MMPGRLVGKAMRQKKKSQNRGVVTVESAVVLLGFFVLVFGMMEASRFLSVHQTLADAAREGARLAVTPLTQTSTLPTDTAIENRVRIFLDSNGLQAATVTITRDVPPTLGGGNDVYTQVTASIAYQVISLAMFSDLSLTLAGSSKMRNETSP